MPDSRKRPAPLPDDFSKVFGSTRTPSASETVSPTRAIQAGPLCPHCRESLAEPHTVRSKANRTEDTDIILIFCTRCGCTLGVLPTYEAF